MSKTFALMLVSALAAPVAPQGASVEQYVQDYARQAGYPGVSVVITKGAEVVLARGFGHDSSGAPITAQTPMPVASLSKSFTALAVMQLVEAGKVDLDRPVRDYLPEFRIEDPRGGRITVRHLLEQTSGITDRTLPEKSLPQPDSLAGAVKRARAATLATDPGTKYSYTNTNYHLAARVVEVVAAQPFRDYLRQHVFEPLDMRSTRTIDSAPGDVPAGHIYAYGASIPMPEPKRFVSGSDGVITTADDMAKWLVLQSNGGHSVLSASGIKTMHTPSGPRSTYALGWDTEEDGRVHHGGIWFTYTAYQLLLPSGHGIAVMSNSGIGPGNEGTAQLAKGLAELIEGRTPDAPGPIRLTIDLVLAGLTLLSVALGVRTLRRTGRWAQRMSGRPAWLVVLRLVPRLIPLGLLLALPDLLGWLVGGGRDLTHVQLAHYSVPLVIWSAVASAMGVAVLITRTRALVKS